MRQRLYKLIFFRVLGWKLIGSVDPKIKKCIIIVMPHTSNLDFFIGLLVRGILNVKINFVAKKELFTFPFGYYFRSVGGAPLDRSGGKNNVDATVDAFDKHETFRLALAPEGTRKKVLELRTGFYYIALKANVPIISAALDYGRKEVRFSNPVWVAGDFEADMKKILPHFKDVKGKIPERSFKV